MWKPLKRLSIFSVLFFFVCTLGFAYYGYGDTTLDNLSFLTQDTHQVFSNNLTLPSVFIDQDIIKSFTLILAISNRAPPS
jgi:hypothetical protein